jgi:hypothetical protein
MFSCAHRRGIAKKLKKKEKIGLYMYCIYFSGVIVSDNCIVEAELVQEINLQIKLNFSCCRTFDSNK